jgi:hypothetical protein
MLVTQLVNEGAFDNIEQTGAEGSLAELGEDTKRVSMD